MSESELRRSISNKMEALVEGASAPERERDAERWVRQWAARVGWVQTWSALSRLHCATAVESKLMEPAQREESEIVLLPCSFDHFVRLVALAADAMTSHNWKYKAAQASTQERVRYQPIAQKIRHLRYLVGEQASGVLGSLFDPNHERKSDNVK